MPFILCYTRCLRRRGTRRILITQLGAYNILKHTRTCLSVIILKTRLRVIKQSQFVFNVFQKPIKRSDDFLAVFSDDEMLCWQSDQKDSAHDLNLIEYKKVFAIVCVLLFRNCGLKWFVFLYVRSKIESKKMLLAVQWMEDIPLCLFINRMR